MEVLYREGGFGLNFARGLGIIFCWMALLATLGLASASFLSFPVAAFLSLGVLTMALSSGTMANAVSEGTMMGYNSETEPDGPLAAGCRRHPGLSRRAGGDQPGEGLLARLIR